MDGKFLDEAAEVVCVDVAFEKIGIGLRRSNCGGNRNGVEEKVVLRGGETRKNSG